MRNIRFSKIEYNPKDFLLSCGEFSCNGCGVRYSVINNPVHLSRCEFEGIVEMNGNCTYHYGLKEVRDVLRSSNGKSRYGALTREVLEANLDSLPEEVLEVLRGK